MKRRMALAAAASAFATPWLAGCGGGSADGTRPRLRLLNASVGYPSLDLLLDDEAASAGVAYATAGAYVAVDDSPVATSIAASGSGSTLSDVDRSLADRSDYTLLAYGWAGSLKTMLLSDEVDDPDSGKCRLRVMHAAPDAGAVDVYVTGANENLDNATPLSSGLAGDALGSFSQFNAGSWRVRVVGAGNPGDLRLDLPAVALAAGEVLTLVLVSGTGGVLVSAMLVAQRGAVTRLDNPAGRVRVVASLQGAASITVQAAGITVLGGGVSPTVGSYVQVPAGSQALAVTVGGVAVSVPALAVVSGADASLLVHGTPAAPVVTVITDNNRLPGGSTNVKLRLVHAAVPLSAVAAEMTVDLSAVVSGVPYASASAYVTLAANAAADIAASTPLSIAPVFSTTDANLAAKGVYTLFLLTAGTAVQGVLRKEA